VDAIPDLWRRGETEVLRLYQLYLCRLQMHGRHERIIAVCGQIRRHANRGLGRAAGLFTFSIEIDSLCALKDYAAAWRRLQRQEEIATGKRFDLRRRRWSRADGFQLEFSYAPLLYFRGRYRQGCELLETALDYGFVGTKPRSFDTLFRVYNGEADPSHLARVTLSHFYQRLGRDLRQWRHWRAFVNGFHPRLFRLSGISREELLVDPARLAPFVDKLMEVRDQRITTGIGRGQSDLVDSATRVQKRQDELRSKLNAFKKRTKPLEKKTNGKLRELFPELQRLPSCTSSRRASRDRTPDLLSIP
jgi:hypothetical protein